MADSINTKTLVIENETRLVSGSAATKASESGTGHTRRVEPIPTFIQMQTETLIKSNNVNASIVLGNDRPGNSASGHGGKGHTQNATIDLVVGRTSLYVAEQNKSKKLIYVHPNMKADAARVYISQKTDVDDNFELVDGKIGNSKNKSAVAIKADGIRIIGREGIKLVTKTDFANSTNNEVIRQYGVDIIANNNDATLQPMVLGTNLSSLISELIAEIDNLQNRLASFVENQQSFNEEMANHIHISPFFGKPTKPAMNLNYAMASYEELSTRFKNLFNHDTGLHFQKINFVGINNKYLSDGSQECIKSKYNNVN
jgi:hypothetical protein